jgi:hypothetical protein
VEPIKEEAYIDPQPTLVEPELIKAELKYEKASSPVSLA